MYARCSSLERQSCCKTRKKNEENGKHQMLIYLIINIQVGSLPYLSNKSIKMEKKQKKKKKRPKRKQNRERGLIL